MGFYYYLFNELVVAYFDFHTDTSVFFDESWLREPCHFDLERIMLFMPQKTDTTSYTAWENFRKLTELDCHGCCTCHQRLIHSSVFT